MAGLTPADAVGTRDATRISLRAPSKYVTEPSRSSTTGGEPFVPLPPGWLWGTWSVTHSTLAMWRSAQNVRITYTPLGEPSAEVGATPVANDNLVEYEKKKKGGKAGGVKRVVGVEKPHPTIPSAWVWRGKGLLAIASSHWEVLGWGERPLPPTGGDNGDEGADGAAVERWAVTWFAPTLFTQEGVDIYSDRREGLSKETVEDIIAALKELKDAPKVVQMVEKSLQEVDIDLPWAESGK
ncbi:hypothetical protein GGS23DRAFT_479477 [Durotheca rogersii]|uniref:uncharacterized protein n=1 Tax=Durotheca rogersii TaxID=419775 RepID=UPI0022210685|nr:uncharacterized protein GGS23DRAFT_479477 [Durotheca rogersii]KAI5864029.1 hypothetical protein GGS23DRAFT_479477 [Durotheca rogersii]